jgi:hypothetical protein
MLMRRAASRVRARKPLVVSGTWVPDTLRTTHDPSHCSRFFIGDIGNPDYHHVFELFAAIVVNLIATVLKFGDRTHIGAVHLATSLVADLQLIAAALVWAWAVHISQDGLTAHVMASVVSLSGGALLANLISVVLLITETATMRR